MFKWSGIMKKVWKLVIGGLQQKVFNLVLFTIILVVAAYTAVLLYQYRNLSLIVSETGEKQLESIHAISDQTMTAVVENTMQQSSQLEGYIADGIFREMKSEVLMLGDFAQKLFSEPDTWPRRPVSIPDPANDGMLAVQLLLEEGLDAEDPELAEDIGIAGNMADMLTSVFRNENINSSFIATADGALIVADDRSGSKFHEDGTIETFPTRERPWYTGAAESGDIYFTDIEADVFTGRIGIVCALPVVVDGSVKAVVGTEMFLDAMEQAVVESAHGDGGFVCIINQNGHVIFSPWTEGIFQKAISEQAADLRQSEEPELAAFAQEALTAATGVKLIQVDGKEYYMSGVPMETVGWALLSVIDQEITRQPTVMLQQQYDDINAQAQTGYREKLGWSRNTILALLLLVFLLGSAAALTLAKRIVHPLNTITKRIAGLSSSNLLFEMEDTYKTGDEIEVLAEAFAKLSAKTVKYVNEVKRVTAEKERIGAELNVAAQIQANILPRIFPAFPDRPEFDIYASMTPAKLVGGDFYDFFLIDSDHVGLVMADVSGKGVPAALFMMVARTLIKNRLQTGESPAQVLKNVNAQLLEGDSTNMFVTVWLAVLEISTGKGVAANAGHEHPVLCRKDGKYELVVYRHSPAVATVEGLPFREHDFEMHPGDSLFVYTDGVPEATNSSEQFFGTELMLKALNRQPHADPKTTLTNVMDGITSFVAGAEQFDDITMLCVKYIGPKASSQEEHGATTWSTGPIQKVKKRT